MDYLDRFITQLDCRDLVRASGVDVQVTGDGSMFVDCTYCKDEDLKYKSIKVNALGFFCFESRRRGGFKDLAFLLQEMPRGDEKTEPPHASVFQICEAIIKAEQNEMTEAEAAARIAKALYTHA